MIERSIDRQSHDSCDVAARLLRRSRNLSARTGQMDAWHTYRPELHERYRTRRLLQEQLAAGR